MLSEDPKDEGLLTPEAAALVFNKLPLREIASNPNVDVPTRLEAFEDLFDSEVGDTLLVRARNLERELGIRQLYLKFEGGNPTGTQKDRIAFGQAMDAMRRGFDIITLASCGNYGAAMALAASLSGLKCKVFIPGHYQTRRIFEITRLGAEVIRVSGDYEEAVKISCREAAEHEWYDANPGGQNTPLQLTGYGAIAYEIYDELRDAPAVMALPVSNGTTLAGVYRGFLSLYRRGKISHLPKMVAGSTFRKNPIIEAFLKNRDSCEDLIPERIKETGINEPLVNWHAIDGDQALDAIRSTEGWADNVTDKAMSHFAKLVREKEGIHVLPASCAGLAALIQQHEKQPLPGDRYVAVLTGRKL